MNILLISLKQRIRDIGLRKALGALNSDIFAQFLVEAIGISLVGTVIGVIVGIFVTYVVAIIVQNLGYNWPFILTFESVGIAFVIALAIGIIFGLYPAKSSENFSYRSTPIRIKIFYESVYTINSNGFKNLSQNATRTFITLIGIVLSIAAIIMVMSAGESVKQFILGQLGVFGTDLIQVEPRVPSGTTSQDRSSTSIVNALTRITTLNLEDGEAIQKLDNIETFSGGSFGQGQIRYSRERSSSMIFGTSPDMIIVDENIVISEGRFYSEEEDRSLGQVAVLGSGLKEKLFGNRNAVGEKIEINGKGYRVIGVLKEREVPDSYLLMICCICLFRHCKRKFWVLIM